MAVGGGVLDRKRIPTGDAGETKTRESGILKERARNGQVVLGVEPDLHADFQGGLRGQAKYDDVDAAGMAISHAEGLARRRRAFGHDQVRVDGDGPACAKAREGTEVVLSAFFFMRIFDDLPEVGLVRDDDSQGNVAAGSFSALAGIPFVTGLAA